MGPAEGPTDRAEAEATVAEVVEAAEMVQGEAEEAKDEDRAVVEGEEPEAAAQMDARWSVSGVGRKGIEWLSVGTQRTARRAEPATILTSTTWR